MEHKAFIFDTDKFNNELKEIFKNCNDEIEVIRSFINQHIGEIKSPYEEEYIDSTWEKQLENKDLQEYADFAMAYYYDVEYDYGLGYYWEAILKCIKRLKLKYNPEYYMLGASVSLGSEELDPGRLGLGIVDAKDIDTMAEELITNKKYISKQIQVLIEISDGDLDAEDLMEAYSDLCELYVTARVNKSGILMTF